MQPAIDASYVALESPTPAPPVNAAPSAPIWSPAKRILFRFAFAYLVLYNFPYPLDFIPYVGEMLSALYRKPLTALVHWVGTHLFHADTSILPNGSGDTTYSYVQVFCLLVIALAVTAVWTVLDRKRLHYTRLHEGLRVYVRFALGAAMIEYGAVKIIRSQFPDPPLDRLLQPYGDASPMGLVWTFMGASWGYNIITGAAEMIGGLLLTVRRTTLLGALVSFAALSDIVALNFFYDIHVKLFSSHLLAMAVFLIIPDMRRLIDMLVLGRRVEPIEIRPLFRRPWLRRGTLVLRTLLVLAFTAYMLNFSHQIGQRPKSPLYGIWNVDELEIDGQVRPPLVTDRERWRRVIFHYPGTMAVQLMSDSRVRYSLELDKGVMTLGKRGDTSAKWQATLFYTRPNPGLLTLEGTLDGRKIRAKLHWEKPPKFLLTSHGFHWINERDEIAFLRASPEQQERTVLDAVLGPEGSTP